MLEICKTAQQNAGGASKPPMLQYESAQQQEAKLLSKSVVDKATNTSHENLVTCCRISDKCDNQTNCNKKKKARSKCCEVANNNAITCSTNSINFDNLQLQCMCSSDNNSIEDEENGEGEACHHVGSFRERLLNLSGASKQDDSNLRKRASELVLGTNFDTPVYKNNQSYRISKTFDSCDNIYKPSKSNHSLSTESDQKSIPYNYLERPAMKLSQSDDKNLRELKIALSTNLPTANLPPPTRAQPIATTAQIITTHSPSTSSTSSSKIDKISFSLSTSSTSDALAKQQRQLPHFSTKISDKTTMIDEQQQQHQQFHDMSIDSQSDNKSEEDDDNKMITATTTTTTCENNNKTAMSNVNNNNNVNNGNNSAGGSRKRKGPEGKLAIDLNDRSKYTEEVSV